MALALLAILSLQDLPAEQTLASGNLLARLPAGWKFEQREEGVFLRPGDLKDDEAFVVIILPGTKADGNLAECFEKAWGKAAGRKKVVKKAPARDLKTEGGIEGLMTVGLLETDEEVQVITAVAVFKPGDRVESVLALTAQDGVFQRYSEAFGAFLKGLRFRNVELSSYELILSMGSADQGGKTTVYVLFKDGTWLPHLPDGGMEGFDAAAYRKKTDDALGTSESKDGVLTLRLGARVEELKAQPDGSYRSAQGQYVRIPSSTGLALDGRFILRGRDDNPDGSSLVFKPNGTFEDRGGGAAFIGPAEARLNPPKSGRYEIANNTLLMKYGDWPVRKVSFAILPRAGDAPAEMILINGAWFRRG